MSKKKTKRSHRQLEPLVRAQLFRYTVTLLLLLHPIGMPILGQNQNINWATDISGFSDFHIKEPFECSNWVWAPKTLDLGKIITRGKDTELHDVWAGKQLGWQRQRIDNHRITSHVPSVLSCNEFENTTFFAKDIDLSQVWLFFETGTVLRDNILNDGHERNRDGSVQSCNYFSDSAPHRTRLFYCGLKIVSTIQSSHGASGSEKDIPNTANLTDKLIYDHVFEQSSAIGTNNNGIRSEVKENCASVKILSRNLIDPKYIRYYEYENGLRVTSWTESGMAFNHIISQDIDISTDGLIWYHVIGRCSNGFPTILLFAP